MLAFDDQALARICIGATAVPRRARSRFLREIGRLIDEARKADKLASGKEGKRKSLGSPKDPRDRPSLAEQGVDKHLASAGRRGSPTDPRRSPSKADKLAKASGSNQHRKKERVSGGPAPSLAEQGVDKNLAHRARSPAARRQARVRARRRNGVHVYRLELPDCCVEGLIEMMVASGRLSEREALQHQRLEGELARLLQEQGERWTR